MTAPAAVGVFFGGRSVEHEVSVITAQQAIAALPRDRFRAVPLYVAKSGAWYTGDALLSLERFRDIDRLIPEATRVAMRADPESGGRLFEAAGRRGLLGGGGARVVDHIDVALPLIHGSHGEDGTLQGLFELSDVAYAGCGVAASALSMDKHLAKMVLRSAGLRVLDDMPVSRSEWQQHRDLVRAAIESRFAYPLYVKPRTLGSSIGVARAQTTVELDAGLETAFVYDSRCLVEAAQEDVVEINCAALGRGDAVRPSVCEQPVSGGLLTYADKYLTKADGKQGLPGRTGMKGARRLIPAPLPEPLTERVQEAAVAAFKAIGAEGVARVDFLVSVERGEVTVNEVNTVPGSLSFYLWEQTQLPFADLLTELLGLAAQRRDEKVSTSFSIDSWLLSGRPPG